MRGYRTGIPLIVLACLILVSFARSQSGDGPQDWFFDKSDNGETIHVLPLPASIRLPWDLEPLFAINKATVYPASYGSGNLIDRGGLEISGATFQAIYWNSGVSNSTATSLGYSYIKDQIAAFISHFPDNSNWDNSATDDYPVIQQYGSTSSISSTLGNPPALLDGRPAQSNIRDSAIQSYLASLFTAGILTPNSNTIYGVYFPHGMKVLLTGGSSCSSFCGYHSHFTYGTYQIKYAVFPYPDCSGCKLSSLSVADMLTIIGSHEIREAVTDPGDSGNSAWYDRVGYEADDKCAWHHLYQIGNGGFWVQPEYSNGGTVTASGFTGNYPGPGCVVP